MKQSQTYQRKTEEYKRRENINLNRLYQYVRFHLIIFVFLFLKKKSYILSESILYTPESIPLNDNTKFNISMGQRFNANEIPKKKKNKSLSSLRFSHLFY